MKKQVSIKKFEKALTATDKRNVINRTSLNDD